ncbi:MAG TPA: hypothetical protein VHM24_05090, partial [Gemmatimonadaceae bacterium]|nr:hypothetical protein [Gemmatimonadaceae bacterium]
MATVVPSRRTEQCLNSDESPGARRSVVVASSCWRIPQLGRPAIPVSNGPAFLTPEDAEDAEKCERD